MRSTQVLLSWSCSLPGGRAPFPGSAPLGAWCERGWAVVNSRHRGGADYVIGRVRGDAQRSVREAEIGRRARLRVLCCCAVKGACLRCRRALGADPTQRPGCGAQLSSDPGVGSAAAAGLSRTGSPTAPAGMRVMAHGHGACVPIERVRAGASPGGARG